MKRVYNKRKNVYEAARERIEFIFDHFERVYVSFSGGKDSGVMLNMMIDYMREHGITKKLGVLVMDNETNYTQSLDFMYSILDSNLDILDIHWCCLPISLPCSVSSYRINWQCWGETDKERWVRPRPDKPYIVHSDNHTFQDWFVPNMEDKDFYAKFARWYSRGKPTANLIGIRTVESLRRYHIIMRPGKQTYQDEKWTTYQEPNIYTCYPLYDWKTEDIWTANAKFGWEYNTLYDIFYMAGVPLGSMRVASAFMSESKSSLGMYRVIDPITWAKLCARVQGANFIATYGKQLNYRTFSLPEGHTWKSFVKFLLATLPEEVAANFRKIFIQSFRVWGRIGRGLEPAMIEDLKSAGIEHTVGERSTLGARERYLVKIKRPPDHCDNIPRSPGSVHSWKRFALTILKNDHVCKYLGLAPTKDQMERQKAIQAKYSRLAKDKKKEKDENASKNGRVPNAGTPKG